MWCPLLSRRRLIAPAPAAHRAALRDHPVQTEVPRIARNHLALLEGVSETDQARGPGRASKGAVVVATAAPHPRPGFIPGQQGYHGNGVRHVPLLELRAERLQKAKGAGPEVRPAPVLGKVHRFPDQAGKVDSFSGRERCLDQGSGRHFVVGRNICQQRRSRTEGRECRHVVRGSALGSAQRRGGERPPSAAHRLPDQSFRVVHPVFRFRDGRRWSVLRLRDRTALSEGRTAHPSSHAASDYRR